MELILALSSAIAYGISDFTGGLLTKRASAVAVILLSQIFSCLIFLPVLALEDGAFSGPGMRWGSAAGVVAVSGAALLYRGLAIGRMGVVAPITAVLAAAIPVAFGLSTGERPGLAALTGVAVGLAAVVLISKAPGLDGAEPTLQRRAARLRDAPGVTEALGAGVGFGLFFILLERAPDDSGLWPLAGTRISMVLCVAAAAAVWRVPVRPAAAMTAGVALLGFTNLAADLLYLLATREGLLSLVAVVTSLYPAATVVLARLVLDERMVRQQLVGVGFAGVSVTLIALG